MAKRKRGVRKPRKQADYNNKAHGGYDNSGPPDDHVINTNLCRVNIQRPQWTKGPMIFRPMPHLRYDDPS